MTSTVDRQQANQSHMRESRFDSSLSIFSTVALILLLWGFCWLKNNTSLRPPQIINVAFHEVAGLNANAGVFVDGVRVGIVDKIEWVESHRVIVRIRINSDRVSIPVGSSVSILTNGVVGAKYVEITMPPKLAGGRPKIPSDAVIDGVDPVRPELAINNLTIALSEIDFPNVRKNLEEDHDRVVLATDQLTALMKKSMPLIEKTIPLEERAIHLSDKLNKVTDKVSRLLDNPNISSDIKETAQQIRITMAHVQEVVKELNVTLTDGELRQDIIKTMDKLNQATVSVQGSMEILQSMSSDKELRGDIKQMLTDARDTMAKVDRIVSDPKFGTDLKETLVKSQDAIEHLDLAARQMNQMMNKRAPLLHMLFGRPGKLPKKKKSAKEVVKERLIEPSQKPKPITAPVNLKPVLPEPQSETVVPAVPVVPVAPMEPNTSDTSTVIPSGSH
ncbi:MCE family protein [Candidatus Obscuribacterales bacterium]|nr:MCE family protein [Candidatus Obscuribacterales bacterium]